MSTAFRAGVFAVLALAILSVGIFLIGSKDFLFSRTYVVKSDFKNVDGLINGAEVRVGGIHQGTVKQIELPSQPGGEMTVVMKMRDTTRNVIKTDSKAAIKTEGILGDKYVEISFGSGKGGEIQNGATIGSEKPTDMSERANALADEAKSAIEAFHDDMDALQHNFLMRGFFEKRGYNDSSELKRNTIARLPTEAPMKEFDYDAADMFEKSDNAKLKNKKRLDEAGQYLQDNKFGLAVIASSEATGDTTQDRAITEARAKVVRDYLVQNFKLDDTHIKTAGLGKSKDANESSKLAILIYPARSQARPDQKPASSSP